MSNHYTVISKSVLFRLLTAADEYRWFKRGHNDPIGLSIDRGKLAAAIRKGWEAHHHTGLRTPKGRK